MDFNYNITGLDSFGKLDGFGGLAALSGALLIIFIVFLIVLLPFVVVYLIGNWKLYQKAGKKGWESIIPIYSKWVYVEIAGLNQWWFCLLIASSIFSLIGATHLGGLASIAGIVGSFFCNYNISKKLHKDTGFAILMTIFPIVMIPIIGFSKNYVWDSSVTVSKNGPIDDNSNNGRKESTKTEDNVKDKKELKFCPNCGKEISNDAKFCGSCGKEI